MILPKNIFSKHQNIAEFKNLDDSEVLSSDFPVLVTSTTWLQISKCHNLRHLENTLNP